MLMTRFLDAYYLTLKKQKNKKNFKKRKWKKQKGKRKKGKKNIKKKLKKKRTQDKNQHLPLHVTTFSRQLDDMYKEHANVQTA
jgi:hypothetical protein